jgi:hypothetical protein
MNKEGTEMVCALEEDAVFIWGAEEGRVEGG